MFTLRLDSLRLTNSWHRCDGDILIFVNGEWSGLAGSRIETTVSLRRPGPPHNPGDRDSARSMQRRGIAALASVAAPDTIMQLPTPAGGSLSRALHLVKRRLTLRVDRALPMAQAAIVRCLVLGDRGALSDIQEEAFERTGTMHFLAVSGLHVGIIAAFCWYVALIAGMRHRSAALLVLCVAIAYALLTGFRPSAQRAAIMCAAFCGAFVFHRRPSLPDSIALAAAAILIVAPEDLFSAGFCLSFAAVFGIVVFARPLDSALFGRLHPLDRLQAPEERAWWRHPGVHVLRRLVALSLSAWLVTQPLVMLYFATITPWSPVASVLLVPAVWLVLAAGLPGVAMAGIWETGARPLLFVAGLGAGIADRISGALASVPHVSFRVPPPGWAWVGLCGAVAVAAALRERLRLGGARVALICLVPALVYLGGVWYSPPPDHPTVSALSMGEGACVVVRFPSGHTLLYDAGSRQEARASPHAMARTLWTLGVRRLDVVVISHADADHYNAFPELARWIPVGVLATPEGFSRGKGGADLLRSMRPLAKESVEVTRGDRISGLGDASVEVLWPPRNAPSEWRLSDNDCSALLRIRTPDGSVLLTGDLVRRGAEMLLARGDDLSADVVLVPHHGLPDAEGWRLVESAHARIGIVPGGRAVSADSPYRTSVGMLLATDDCGMITVEMERGQSRVRTFLGAAGDVAKGASHEGQNGGGQGRHNEDEG